MARMPNASTHKCPACGEALNAPVQGGRIKCSFCGTLVTVEAQDKKRGDEIICPECGAVNPKDAQHCGRCGIKLEFNCPKCSAINTYGTVFCVKCGVDIQGEINRQQEQIQHRQEAELKQQNELRLQAERAKTKKRVSTLAGIGVAFVTLLCIAAVLGISLYTTRYSPTARATRTAVAAGKTATAEYLTLFHDDFSDATSGWGSLEGENGTANYAVKLPHQHHCSRLGSDHSVRMFFRMMFRSM
jgi:ribosomal protein L40E